MAQKKYLDLAGLQYFIGKLVEGKVKNAGLISNVLKAKMEALTGSLDPDKVSALDNRIKALEALISEDGATDKVIDKFNEIVSFLAGIENTDTLQGLFADVAAQLATKIDKAEGFGLYPDADKAKVANVPADTNAAIAAVEKKVDDHIADVVAIADSEIDSLIAVGA